jgi:uncharacterized membrane-anchored protein
MDKKKIIFLVFCLIVVAQLYVPAKMIFDREDILITGKAYKFKTAPIDPSDPFRGKYIVLNFEANTAQVPADTSWDYNTPVYVMLTVDTSGYAKVDAVSHDKPDSAKDFVLAKSLYFNNIDNTITIDYPFNRYYMEESKAQDAEDLYRYSLGDTTQLLTRWCM